LIPQVPEQRHLAITLELLLLSIDPQLDHRTLSRKKHDPAKLQPAKLQARWFSRRLPAA
jgi:hypothetical protein